jgi:hypothetical protein
VNCDWKLNNWEDLEIASVRFTHLLQQAAEIATPKPKPYVPLNNILSTIKQLVALKPRAKETWQKTHAPNDRRTYNASKKLRTALYQLRNDNLTEYVSNLKSSDHSIWKPLNSSKNQYYQTRQFAKPQTRRAHGQRTMRKRLHYFPDTYWRSSPRMTIHLIHK